MKDVGLWTKKVLRDYFESVVLTVLLAIVVRVCLVGTYRVPSYSMYPALREGDFIFAYKWSYGLRVPGTSTWLLGPYAPSRGDVVVFKCPTELQASCIKRVVGLPGEKIAIKNNVVVIDGQPSNLKLAGEATHFTGSHDFQVFSEAYGNAKFEIMLKKGAEPVNLAEFAVPQNTVFVLGDSRHGTEDSRLWGPVPLKYLESRAGHIWLSLDWGDGDQSLPKVRWDRMLSSIR